MNEIIYLKRVLAICKPAYYKTIDHQQVTNHRQPTTNPPTGPSPTHRSPTTNPPTSAPPKQCPPTTNHQPTDKCSTDHQQPTTNQWTSVPLTHRPPNHRQVLHQPTDHRLTDSPTLLQLSNNPLTHQSFFNRVTVGPILSTTNFNS